MELHKVMTCVALKKSENQKIKQLQDAYGFCVSAIVFHVAHYVARKLVRKESLCATQSPKETICRYALDIYRPFSLNTNKPVPYSICYSFGFTYDELKDNLKQAGILEPCLFLAAIVKAIIKFPYDASRIKIQGVYTKKKTSISVVKGLLNNKINGMLNLPVEVYDLLKEIAQKSNSSMRGMVVEVLKSICNIEFNNRTFTENHKVFKKVILRPARVIERNKHCQYGRLNISVSDIRLSVQVKAIIEKYGIPSIVDLLKRIVYFILAVHSGDVKLNTVRIEDNDDYNETRLVRDAYRKELIYGTNK